MKNFPKRVIVIAVLALVISTSCKKREVEVPKPETTLQVDISTLKIWFANRINVPVEDIKYDEKTQQFSLWGVDQVDLENLTIFYLNSQPK